MTLDGDPAQDVPPEALSGTPSVLGRLLRFSQRISGRVEDLHVRDAEQQLYADCETLADLGEVTAKWATGEIKYHWDTLTTAVTLPCCPCNERH